MVLRNKRRFLNHIFLPADWWFTRALKWLFIILLAFTLQTQITIADIPFNFVALVVYMFVLQLGSRLKKEEYASGILELEIKSAVFGAALGILDDIISGTIIGPSFLSKGLIGFFVAVLFGSVFFKWTPLLGCIVIFAITTLDGVLQVIIRMVFSEIQIDFFSALSIIMIQALINLPLGLLIKPSEYR